MKNRKEYMKEYRERKKSEKFIDKRKTEFPKDLCLNCSTELPRRISMNRIRKFCNNNKCQHDYMRKFAVENGIAGVGSTKRFLSDNIGYMCDECGISEWQNKKIILQLDHINGNHNDNSIDNVRLLCPNCHSQTPNFCSKNIGKGRTLVKKEPKPFYPNK